MTTMTIPATGLSLDKSIEGKICDIKLTGGQMSIFLDSYPNLKIDLGDTIPEGMSIEKGLKAVITVTTVEGDDTTKQYTLETSVAEAPKPEKKSARNNSPARDSDFSLLRSR